MIKPIKPGSRPGKRWCEWLQAIVEWTPEQRAQAREKADKAWGTKSIRAQYAGLSEMRIIDAVEGGTFKHQHHCVSKGCPFQETKAEVFNGT